MGAKTNPDSGPTPMTRQQGSPDDKLIRSTNLLTSTTFVNAVTTVALVWATIVLVQATNELQATTADLVTITRCESYQAQHRVEASSEAAVGSATGSNPCTDPTRIKQ
ncbi:hypothetical protein AB0K51_31470 [Kitasatospora sp. NPDC049285]|uniref:hypothetical protein n=1 Tax=Kitasatospora sp. NPDC049285 TaxID=3157096 RepID=UPI00344A5C9C